jgi:class 3 adenylate cyclase
LAGIARPLEIAVSTREESKENKELLRRRGPEIYDEEVDRLAEKLGDLPLTIEQAAAWRAETGMRIRMVFAVDIVGFSKRSDPQQRESQERLLALVDQVLRDVRVDIPPNDRESTGDGLNIIFPLDLDLTQALPTLIRATAEQIATDNDRYRHPLRLRMAIGVGPVIPGPTGFGGAAIIEVSRLLDCDALRNAIKDHPDVNLAILVSDLLHSWVIGAGHRGIPAGEFRPVLAIAKDFEGNAWRWCAPVNPDDG